jgi:hypothetical protein
MDSTTPSELLELLPFLTQRERGELDSLVAGPHLDLSAVLFGAQAAFATSPESFVTALCSRRAGKSVGVAAWLAEGPLLNPKAPSLYLTLTRGSAKRIIWSTLLDLNDKHRLGYEANESDLILKRNGRPAIYLAGVDNKREIEKARGTGWGRVAIDEAQSLPEYVKELVEDVLMPSLMDHGGQIRAIGTPSPVPAGYFHSICQSPEWGHFAWTVWDNPHIPEERKRAMLARVLAARGVTVDDPGIAREWFGKWILDLSALVFKFDAARNTYTDLPSLNPAWGHVIGVDLGYDDADAIAVLADNPGSPAVYLREEWVGTKQTITDLTKRLEVLVAKYQPRCIVMDTGGLGKKVAEEIMARTTLPIQAAEKVRKFEFIELLNDSMRSGRFFALPGSRFGHDATQVEWDREKSVGDKLVISDRFHSDIGDAVLYAFRESLAWTHQAPNPPPPLLASAERHAQMEAEYLERAERQIQDQKSEERMWDFDTWG